MLNNNQGTAFEQVQRILQDAWFFKSVIPNYGLPFAWTENYIHSGHLNNNPKLIDIMTERVNYLTSVITQEIQKIPNNLVEKYIPLVREVFQKVSRKISSKHGDINYTGVPLRDESGAYSNGLDWKTMNPLDFININFRATPYNPSIKMVEFATRDSKLDAYNLVIDSDLFLRQGYDASLATGAGWAEHNETPYSLNITAVSPSREIFRFCETLPDWVVSENTEDYTVNTGEDYSRRESYSQLLLGVLADHFNFHDNQQQVTRVKNFHKEDLKSTLFKSSVETIFSELINKEITSQVSSVN